MRFISYAQLANDVRKLSAEVGPILGVCGVPRSGMIAAGMFAQYNGCFLGSVEGIVEGRLYDAGLAVTDRTGDVRNEVLILDDSSFVGQAIRRTKMFVMAKSMFGRSGCAGLKYGAVYATSKTVGELDYHHSIIDEPRLFEWNWLRHHQLRETIFDLDGVICENPPFREHDNDPEKFDKHILNVAPLHLPQRAVHKIVTGRLEKHRESTEKWLNIHGVQFGQLIMCRHDTAEERRSTNGAVNLKIAHYRVKGASLFIESSKEEAKQIATATGGCVLCTEDWIIY